MPGYRDDVRQLRNEMRAKRGAPQLPPRRRSAGQDQPEPSWDEAPQGDDGENSAELHAALQQREDELAETKRLLAEMVDYAEQMEARVIELIVGAEAMAKALLLPGVKAYLLQRFHPDKYPDADAGQHELLTNALQTINAAYSCAGKLQTPDSSSPPS
jgi:hypothetical protein